MGILDTLLASAQAGSLNRAAAARGLDAGSTASLLDQLVPALTAQIKRNASSKHGLESLTGALRGGRHERYLEDPSALSSESAVSDGNGILGHILGSKDASRKLAADASSKTGVNVDLIKQLLPIVAAATMGAMSKDTNAGQTDLGSMLVRLIDADGDGNVVEDLLSLGKKLF